MAMLISLKGQLGNHLTVFQDWGSQRRFVIAVKTGVAAYGRWHSLQLEPGPYLAIFIG